MTLNDPLSNCLSHILNCEKKGKSECIVGPSFKINLIGSVNKCGVVKPRFSFSKSNYERFEKRYLPAKGFGLFIVTTSKGVMTHTEALSQGVGGKLIAYCY